MIFGLGGGLLCIILVGGTHLGLYAEGAGMLQGEKRFFGITVEIFYNI